MFCCQETAGLSHHSLILLWKSPIWQLCSITDEALLFVLFFLSWSRWILIHIINPSCWCHRFPPDDIFLLKNVMFSFAERGCISFSVQIDIREPHSKRNEVSRDNNCALILAAAVRLHCFCGRSDCWDLIPGWFPSKWVWEAEDKMERREYKHPEDGGRMEGMTRRREKDQKERRQASDEWHWYEDHNEAD